MRAMLRRGRRVPILMYHRVLADEEAARGERFCISVRRFEQQLRCLRALRMHSVTLEQVLDALEHSRPLPPRPVAITFDDGYADTYHRAAPLLEQYGFRATLFLVADRVGQYNDWEPDGVADAGRLPLLDWPAARDLAGRDFALGSHSRTHAGLTDLRDAELREEVAGSRRLLEERLGLPVRFFAYPFNETDARCQAAVADAGYRGACAGEAQGYHRWCLDRVDVSHTTAAVFLAKVTPWFYRFRRIRRRLQAPGERRHGCPS